MLDLSFGLPIAVRDAALKLVAQGPSSSINKEYYAQNHEGALKDAQIPEEYEKTDTAARDLLKRLANSEPYYKKRRGEGGESSGAQKRLEGGVGPVRNRGGGGAGGRGGGKMGGGGGKGKGKFPGLNQLPPGPQDILPPDDQSITSLFLTGYVVPPSSSLSQLTMRNTVWKTTWQSTTSAPSSPPTGPSSRSCASTAPAAPL
jgi:pre-mRNA-splicing factor RBM22/SLT11